MRYWKEISLILLYFTTRLTYLTRIPIFNDESTYIRYGLHHVLETQHQFYSLLIGKEPLLPYLFAQFGLLFGDPLSGARLVSVLFGFLTLVGIYYTARLLFEKKAAYIASLIYILAPFTLFFDRLALMDTAISTISVWTLYLVFKIAKKPYWYHAALLGFVLGMGMWVKTSASFFLILAPAVICFEAYKSKKEAKKKFKHSLASLGIALLIFALLYFQPYYAVHRQLLTQYVYSPSSVFQFMFEIYLQNTAKILSYIFFLLTPPAFLLALYSQKKWKDVKFQILFAWFVLPLFYMVLYSKLLTSRHALLLTVPLILLSAYTVSSLQKKKILFYSLLACIFAWMGVVNIILYTSPQQFPDAFLSHARRDMTQYFYGFSSGYGVEESINYLKEKAEKNDITVALRNDTGNPEDAIVAYLHYDPSVTVIPFNDSQMLFESLEKIDTDFYFVSRGPQYAGLEEYLEEEKIFQKPSDTEFVGVYKLNLPSP